MKHSGLCFCLYILLLSACNQQNSQRNLEQTNLFSSPRSQSINVTNGYQRNLLTNQKLQQLYDKYGQPVKSGKPITPKTHHSRLSDFPSPLSIPAKLPTKLPNKSPNYLPLLRLKPLVNQSIEDTFKVLINSKKDTLPTNTPYKVTPKRLSTQAPHIVPAHTVHNNPVTRQDIQYLGIEQGLPLASAHNIVLDKTGNMWFALSRGKISRFDGTFLTNYGIKQGIPDDQIHSMLESKQGYIWFTTNQGVYYFKDTHLYKFSENEGLPNNSVLALLEDSNENLWFGTQNGLVKYDGKSFTCITKNEGLPDNEILALHEDKNKQIWIGTKKGLSKYDGHTVTHYSFSNKSVKNICEDEAGNLWFSLSSSGVVKYDGRQFLNLTTKQGLISNDVLCILPDRDHIWFGTLEGVCKYNNKTQSVFTTYTGIPNDIRCIAKDTQGGIWFGTHGKGVVRLREQSFSHILERQGFPMNRIFFINEDKRNNRWLCARFNAIAIDQGDRVTQITSKEGLNLNGYAKMMIEDRKGNLWFGTRGSGAIKYDGQNFTYYNKNNGFTTRTVWCIFEDSKENLWFGTFGEGLFKYDGQRFTHFGVPQGIPIDNITDILEDRQGNIWVSSHKQGLIKYNGNTYVHYTEKEGLSSNIVRSLLEDEVGNLWIGTNHGVNKFDGKTFTYFTQKEGLNSNSVWSMQQDHQGNIWVATDRGLTHLVFNKQKDKNTKHQRTNQEDVRLYQYTQDDGLKGIDFYMNSVHLDRNNYLWWGSDQSLTKLNLNNFVIPSDTPTVNLRQIDIEGQLLDYAHLSDNLQSNITFDTIIGNCPQRLKLAYFLNHLTFHFSATDLKQPHQLKYSYRIKELGKKWSIPSPKPFADYKNLPSGHYTFQVKGIGASLRWSKIYEYGFVIRTPLWLTWWAKVLYVFSVALIIVGIVQWRTSNLQRKKVALEKKVQERTFELQNANNALQTLNEELKQNQEEIETQRDAIQQRNQLLQRANYQINQSIKSAQVIQNAILPMEDKFKQNFEEYFIIYKPRDIVSGDFYWYGEIDQKKVIGAIDCTGHGIPGAFMSMIGFALLNEIIHTNRIDDPAQIIERLRTDVYTTFKLDQKKSIVGMDAAFVCIDDTNQTEVKVLFAGAKRPLWYIPENSTEVVEIKGDSVSVGIIYRKQRLVNTHHLSLAKNTALYLGSDGFADQNNEKRKKFGASYLKKLIYQNHHLPFKEQRIQLEKALKEHMKEVEQRDDILWVGLRL